ncbi:MAG: hypothetical protein NC355_05165 [Blautia sp.]|nr:hypothetical protein [Blautia sp.]
MEYLFKVTAKKNNKSVSKTLTLTAKVVNASVKADVPETMVVNEEKTLTKSGAPTEATVTYTSDKADIVAVDGNKLTAKKAGEANITVTSSYGATKTYKVAVKQAVLQSVSQKKAAELEFIFAGDTKDIKTSDIVITNTSTKVVFPVASVSPDKKEPTKVTVKTLSGMTDGQTYTVVFDGVTKEFVATEKDVADVAVTPLQIDADMNGTEIIGQTLSKTGVVLSESKLQSGGDSNVEFTVTTTDGWQSGNKLVLPKAGGKATAKITYHTYKYENGSEVGAITKSFEIVAADPTAATVSGFAYTITDKAPTDWSKVTPNTQIPAGGSNKVFFHFTDSNDKDVTGDYTVESADSTIFLLGNEVITSGVSIVAIKEGTAYVTVKKNGTFITSLPVTVTASTKLAKIELSAGSLTVSKDAVGYKTVETTVKAKDQYNNDFSINTGNVTIDRIGSSGTAPAVAPANDGNKVKLTFDAALATKGTYTYRVTVKSGDQTQAATVSVTVVETSQSVSTATDVRIVVEGDTDMAIGDSDNGEKKMTVKLGAYQNGALLGYVDITTLKFNNTVIATTNGAIALTENTNGAWMPKYSAGTYQIEATGTVNSSARTYRTYVAIKDSTQKASVTKVLNDAKFSGAGDNKALAVAAVESCLEISYLGQNKPLAGNIMIKNDGDVKVAGNSVYVGTAYVKITNEKGVSFWVAVDVNRVFTKN